MLQSLFNKVASLQGCKSINKGLKHRCFPVNIVKLLRTAILKNICERLLMENNGFTIVLINAELRSHPVLVPSLLFILKSKYRYFGLFLNLLLELEQMAEMVL